MIARTCNNILHLTGIHHNTSHTREKKKIETKNNCVNASDMESRENYQQNQTPTLFFPVICISSHTHILAGWLVGCLFLSLLLFLHLSSPFLARTPSCLFARPPQVTHPLFPLYLHIPTSHSLFALRSAKLSRGITDAPQNQAGYYR